MNAFLDSSDREYLAAIQRLDRSSVSQLCVECGVTATAVRQKLGRFLALKWIDRQTVHGDRGRPRHLYSLTDRGRSQLGDNYRELAMLLWNEVQSLEEPELKQRLMEKVRRSMVSAYGSSVVGSGTGERMHQLRDGLAERGFDVEFRDPTGEQSLPVLREHACPYHELATKDSSICDLELNVFSEIVGAPLERSHCCLDGDSCCEFQPAAG